MGTGTTELRQGQGPEPKGGDPEEAPSSHCTFHSSLSQGDTAALCQGWPRTQAGKPTLRQAEGAAEAAGAVRVLTAGRKLLIQPHGLVPGCPTVGSPRCVQQRGFGPSQSPSPSTELHGNCRTGTPGKSVSLSSMPSASCISRGENISGCH